jgi:pimeloyl-ACP methyl ester carboxylesterase
MESRSTVVSTDGATISYREIGEGPAVVLLHGALQSAQSFSQLAEMLSTSFRAYVPDRRGRGRSAPFGASYGLATEAADLEALVRKTGARRVFGLSSGAIVALYAAETLPDIEKVAVYEPPLSIDDVDPAAWVPRYERDIDRGDLAAAMATIITGTGDTDMVARIPRLILVPLMRLALRIARAKRGEIALRDLVPTARYDAHLQRESARVIAGLSEIRADLLLLGGDRSHPALRTALDALSRRLPKAGRVMLRDIGHLAADDTGRPGDVAQHLLAFFRGASS